MKFSSAVALVASAFALGLVPTNAHANLFRVDQVPNGPDFGCAICHEGGTGGAPRTPFGSMVEMSYLQPPAPSNGDVVWDASLAGQDADGDGYTNGEELGDPLGEWADGQPHPDFPATHPGDADVFPCGSNTIEGPEECDGAALDDAVCGDFGFDSGEVGCDDTCLYDVSGCFTCGNDMLEPAEECDGELFGDLTCADFGFDGGELGCGDGCAVDTSACFACGDGVVNGDEECDGDALAEATCESLDFLNGSLDCNADCTYDITECSNCGNDMVDAREQCDGDNLADRACTDLGFDSGDLGCDDACQYDLAACVGTVDEVCGDGLRLGDEACEGDQLGGNTCESEGFIDGAIACSDTCMLDTSSCISCGDGVIDEGEQCDGDDLGDATCDGQGFDGGTISCSDSCMLDVSECTIELCGNGDVDEGEQCDGDNLDGSSCQDRGFSMGTLACADDCSFDTSTCENEAPPVCGDGIVAGAEECDGDDFAMATCETEGFDSGDLLCREDCTIDNSTCERTPEAMCGDGVAEGDEECDGDDLFGASCTGLAFGGGMLSCAADCTLDTSECIEAEDLPMDAGMSDAMGSGMGADAGDGDGDSGGSSGCSVTAAPASGLGWLALAGALLLRRRRR